MGLALVPLVLPSFIQINTSCPSTAYLKGYLETKGVRAGQADLGIETVLALFFTQGLGELFVEIEQQESKYLAKVRGMLVNRQRYIDAMTTVVVFLQGKNDPLAYRICNQDYLPESDRGGQNEGKLEWALGTSELWDKACYLTALYPEDLCNLIREAIGPDSGFSRYTEHLDRCASSFDKIEKALQKPFNFIDRMVRPLLEGHIVESKSKVITFDVPFPENLFSSLRLARWLWQTHPDIPILMRGGFVNAELRSITDTRFFKYTNYLLLDDGEDPLFQVLCYSDEAIPKEELIRTFSLDESNSRVVYQGNSAYPTCRQSEIGLPDYEGLPPDKYISVMEVANPMHKFWSDGRWNKPTLVHDYYWGRYTFCDGSSDYTKRYEPNTVKILIGRMECLTEQIGEIGFHSVGEAAPSALLWEMAREIIHRGITAVWWGNIRSEESHTGELYDLLQRSDCIAVSGGLGVASPRLLKLINKGAAVAQVARVTSNFTRADIMVHAYLMYGFPTQTAQEIIDSLETIRQIFELELIQSGFWHRSAMTAHSSVGLRPAEYGYRVTESPFGEFVRNDVQLEALSNCDPELFSEGLRVSLHNYTNGTGFDLPLHKWFGGMKVPRTTLPPSYIEGIVEG